MGLLVVEELVVLDLFVARIEHWTRTGRHVDPERLILQAYAEIVTILRLVESWGGWVLCDGCIDELLCHINDELSTIDGLRVPDLWASCLREDLKE